MRVLIAGGGTGGHLYPGVAVARELLRRDGSTVVSFVGTASGIETRIVPREGFPLDLIRVAGLKRKSVMQRVRGFGLLPLAALDAWRVISRRRPDVVIGVGGFSSGPVLAFAALRGLPTLVLEQNALPGLTNRLLAPLVRAAAVNFEEALRFFPKTGFVAGNPVRSEFLSATEANDAEDKPRHAARVLIVGGSQGAHAINVAMVAAAPRLAAAGRRLAITHQTGERDVDLVRTGYERAGLEARVEAFLYEVHREMKAADMVICRAGATTLAEVSALGRPSILVPLPTATDDHQRKNAAVLANAGAAIVVDERELAGARLADEIVALAGDRERREHMGVAARRLSRPDAAERIADRVEELSRRQPATGNRQTVEQVLGKTRRVHFVGIGGIGMSGIAELLANLGYGVSGSDARRSTLTDRLETLGVTVHVGHAAVNVGDADVVVYSAAVRPDNPELVDARSRRIPVIPRAEMLAELMRLRFGIAIAGAHGKTSTTSMIALVLERAGLDPTAVIGGRLSAFGSNARLGGGEYMVAEADESDRSFLKLSPSVAVITNIDREHMEAYGGFEDLQQAFVDFANKVPFYGAVVACADDPALARILPRLTRRVITYGIDAIDANVGAIDVVLKGFGSHCSVVRRAGSSSEILGTLTLAIPGRHSVENALAAVAVGLELDVPFARISDALAQFQGAERRFERRGVIGGVTVVDDYGHHPTEIAAVIAAARAVNPRRIVVAFQPHRYTRTRDLMAEFVNVLSLPDEVVLTEIYAASEDPIPGVTLDALAAAVDARRDRPVHVVRRVDDMARVVADLARAGDLVLTLGAGSISSLAPALVTELEHRQPTRGVH